MDIERIDTERAFAKLEAAIEDLARLLKVARLTVENEVAEKD